MLPKHFFSFKIDCFPENDYTSKKELNERERQKSLLVTTSLQPLLFHKPHHPTIISLINCPPIIDRVPAKRYESWN